MIGLLLSVAVLASGAAGFMYFQHKPAGAPAEAAKPVPEKPIFVTLEPMTVNLQAEGRKYLHVGMSLKVKDEASKAQIVEFMPELRSRALLLLSNRAPDTLMSTEDKSRIADEVREALNRPLNDTLPPQGIASVSFNTFVVQ